MNNMLLDPVALNAQRIKIYNPKIAEAFPEIIKRSKAYYDTEQKRIKSERETAAKRTEKLRQEKERQCQADELYSRQEAEAKKQATEKLRRQKAESEKNEITRIHQETGGYVSGKVNGRYDISSLEELTSMRPTTIQNEYTQADFDSRIEEIQTFKSSGVRRLYAKMCHINQNEITMLLQVYHRLESTNPETAHVIEYLMIRAGIEY